MTRTRPGRGTVDRFVEDQVVLDVDGKEVVLPRNRVADEAREGDVVDLATGKVDAKATAEARDRVKALQKKAQGTGDFEL